MRSLFKQIIIVQLLMLFGGQVFAQVDSLVQAKNDSILSNKLEKGDKLLASVDSVRFADSLAQASIERQIAELRSSDSRSKERLQARLDSLQTAKVDREMRVKMQVDSLRKSTRGMPVVLFGDSLFQIYAKIGPFTAAIRAENISNKLERLVDENLFNAAMLKIIPSEESHDVVHDEIILFSITDRDAFWLDKSREEVAELYLNLVVKGVADYEERTSTLHTALRFGKLFLVLVLLFIILRLLNAATNFITQKLLAKSENLLTGISFKNYEFLSKERETQLVQWLLNAAKWLVILIVLYLALPLIFSIFPSTAGYADTLIHYILDPLKMFVSAVVNYIPEMITIAVIMFVTHSVVRFMKFLTGEIADGKLVVPGFYPDWAYQTFNLLRFIVYAFSLVIIFPYLPGSDSLAFQGVSVFLGLLISMGSSSAISNIIAGLVITYMRAFKIGDRVKIGDTVGDVVEKTMLVTRLRTIKNEEVSIPNSAIMNGSTINFSYSAEHNIGLILHSTVTIGYDVPWRTVHELLIKAALKTEKLKEDPTPFVLQTGLDDFYVSYQINAYTDYSRFSAKIYSELHSNIQDAFNEAGVEILSPHYRAARDGNTVTIPPQYLPNDYKAPSFNVNLNKES